MSTAWLRDVAERVILVSTLIFAACGTHVDLGSDLATATPSIVDDATAPSSCRLLDVQPIFDRDCATAGCHSLPTPAQGLNLVSGFTYASAVDVVSTEAPPMKLVLPFDAANSYLYRRIIASSPHPSKGLPTAAEGDLIKCWIDEGAAR